MSMSKTLDEIRKLAEKIEKIDSEISDINIDFLKSCEEMVKKSDDNGVHLEVVIANEAGVFLHCKKDTLKKIHEIICESLAEMD